eukprot:12964882-Alexandrium_andersonii.AAC.1
MAAAGPRGPRPPASPGWPSPQARWRVPPSLRAQLGRVGRPGLALLPPLGLQELVGQGWLGSRT